MPEALGDERWAAIRALCEGALPTNERVAAATGVYVKSLSRRSTAEGWRMLDFRRPRVRTAHQALIEIAARALAGEELDGVDEEGEREAARFGEAMLPDEPEPWPDAPPAERMARIGAVLTRQTETMLRRLDAGRPLESRQVTALNGLVALAERIAVLAQQEIRQEEEDRDDKVREALQAIDRRVIFLAQCEAREIAIRLFGIPRAEVDAKLPVPVDRSQEIVRQRRRKERGLAKAGGGGGARGG